MIEFHVPSKTSTNPITMDLVFSHSFDSSIISISESNNGQLILITTKQKLYILSLYDCLHKEYKPTEYPNAFPSSTKVHLLESKYF